MNDDIRTERLKTFLNKIMGDEEIKAGPRFLPRGLAKIASHMGVTPEEVPALLDALVKQLRSVVVERAEEDEPRYSYEEDTLGGITVRDTLTGQERFLTVQQAALLMQMMDDDQGTEQAALAQAMTDRLDESNELSADEMLTGSATFNFPCVINETLSFGTAQFSGFGRHFKLQVLSVVDQSGNEITEFDQRDIRRTAMRYIGDA